MNKITTGLTGLDEVLGGGLPENTVTLLSGGPGTGKTLLGLNFLMHGAAAGEKCCYISVSENREELLRACDCIESLKKAHKYIDKNLIFKDVMLGENIDMDHFVDMFQASPKIDRLVIDSTNKFLITANDSKDYRVKLSKLIRHLKSRAKSTIMICETTGDSIDMGHGESFECDGVIRLSFLDLEEKPMRILQVHKLRYTDFEPRISHEFVISKKDIRLGTSKAV